MKRLKIPFAALLCAFPLAALAQDSFQRPDCATYKTENQCIREIRKTWQAANFAALQKTGLMFIYMARPDPATSPAARKAVEDRTEGSFSIHFSVAKDGTVVNVKTEHVTAGIAPLAKLWAETIGQWTFTKIDQPVADIEFRRIYLYPKEETAPGQQERSEEH